MNKNQLIENMEAVMMDLVKYRNEYKSLISAEEMAELDQEMKATAKAFNFLLNRTYKNNKKSIARHSWVYETMLAEMELAR